MQSTSVFSKKPFWFLFWFLINICISTLYGIFDQPLLNDHAYLLYMGQVIFRGDALYSSTTFGYPPMAALIAAGAMKIGDFLFDAPTYLAPRFVGLILNGITTGGIYLVGRKLFRHHFYGMVTAALYCSFGWVNILSTTNLEPLLLVTCALVLGLYQVLHQRWFYAGILLAIGAWSWQPGVLNVLAVGLLILGIRPLSIKIISRYSIGVFIGSVPTFIYLLIHNDWEPFFKQAVIRKAVAESSIMAFPFKWLGAFYPQFTTEFYIFLLALIGFVYFIISIKKRESTIFKKKQPGRIVVIITLCWSVFNTIEFDGAPDIIPLLPVLCIWAMYGLKQLFGQYGNYKKLLLPIIFIVGLWDTIVYKPMFTLKEEIAIIDKIKAGSTHGHFIAIGFEELFVILEQPLPTKYMRFQQYEDVLIDMYEPDNKGCAGVIQKLEKAPPEKIVISDENIGLCGLDIKSTFTAQDTPDFVVDIPLERIFVPGLKPKNIKTVRVYKGK